MKWYYAEAGQQVGPVDDAQFRQLVIEGKIRAETLVWREGMADWLPYRVVYEQFQGGAAASGSAASGLAAIYATGAPQAADPDALVAEVLARDYQIDIGSCISRGWELVKKNFGLTVGATFLVMLCVQIGGFIPILGVFIALVLQGPLTGGLYVLFLKLIRGQPASLEDAFSGFKRFWPLAGTFLLMALLLYAWFIPGALLMILGEPGGPLFKLGIALLIVGMLGLIWLAVGFMFAIPLAADLHLRPWKALTTSFKVVKVHWFSVFALVFVAGLLSALGLIACIIGVFVTLPIFYAAILYAYEDIFRR
jgi:hypothetical protein